MKNFIAPRHELPAALRKTSSVPIIGDITDDRSTENGKEAAIFLLRGMNDSPRTTSFGGEINEIAGIRVTRMERLRLSSTS